MRCLIIHQVGNSTGNYNYNAYFYTDIRYIQHFHKNFELIYVCEGDLELIINSEKLTLSQNELIILEPYSVHSFYVNDVSKIWVAVFSEDYIHDFAKKNRDIRFSKFKCEKTIEDFLKGKLFYEGKPDLYTAKSCLYLICGECLKNAYPQKINLSSDFKGRVIEYISANLNDEISLVSAAKALDYEYHYFSSLFHKCFGVNFKQFINLFRFELACDLLNENEKDISEIAGICGFQSIRNFNRVFKSLSGYTPSEYKKQIIC